MLSYYVLTSLHIYREAYRVIAIAILLYQRETNAISNPSNPLGPVNDSTTPWSTRRWCSECSSPPSLLSRLGITWNASPPSPRPVPLSHRQHQGQHCQHCMPACRSSTVCARWCTLTRCSSPRSKPPGPLRCLLALPLRRSLRSPKRREHRAESN
jgi:hypothetical protein